LDLDLRIFLLCPPNLELANFLSGRPFLLPDLTGLGPSPCMLASWASLVGLIGGEASSDAGIFLKSCWATTFLPSSENAQTASTDFAC
jgi:hypothetical protein